MQSREVVASGWHFLPLIALIFVVHWAVGPSSVSVFVVPGHRIPVHHDQLNIYLLRTRTVATSVKSG